MKKEQVLKGGYKKTTLNNKVIIIIILSTALVCSIVANFSILNSIFNYQKYFQYLNTLSTIKTQKGVQEIKKINQDFAMWLTCDDVDISLPVVTKTNVDDDFYYTHDFKKQKNALGNPFTITASETASNRCIIATNTLTIKFFGKTQVHSLFGKFKQYLVANKNFNNTLTLETPSKQQNFQVISSYAFDVNSNYYDKYLPCNISEFENEQDFANFYKLILENSAVSFNLNAQFGDKFITLFFTDPDNLSNRIVIVAKEI